ncbi:hypothetical protein E4U21_004970 [Claviceps maximensis]|nr:hypothetical protein E4U21_004970 [Claviceps maximensis]
MATIYVASVPASAHIAISLRILKASDNDDLLSPSSLIRTKKRACVKTQSEMDGLQQIQSVPASVIRCDDQIRDANALPPLLLGLFSQTPWGGSRRGPSATAPPPMPSDARAYRAASPPAEAECQDVEFHPGTIPALDFNRSCDLFQPENAPWTTLTRAT